MTQLERITHYEEILDKIDAAVSDLDRVLETFDAVQPLVRELDDYYGSDDWFSDRELRLPPGTKAGILSEDLLYDRFTDLHALAARMRRSADALSAAIGPGTDDASA